VDYTTYPDETVIYTHSNGEVLCEVEGRLEPHRKFFVAVTKDGFCTDYPLWTGTGVVWDNPERFTKAFRIAATNAIAKLNLRRNDHEEQL